MATYAAIVSGMHLMEQIQMYHAQHPIFNDSQQRQLESLGEKVSFLQDFLETYSYKDSDEAENLESRIVDAAYAAEDVIESYIVDDIHCRKSKIQSEKNQKKISRKMEANKFSQDVQKIIELIDSIKREILKIKDRSRVRNDPHHPKEPEQSTGSLGLLNIEKDTVVGLDDIFNSIMEKLIKPQSSLQFIAITGMGGSGKSTLAKKIYDNRFTKEHFDICAWVTISQEFNVKEVLLGLLRETGGPANENFEYHQLGEQLHKHLLGRRFFIVIDDIWSVEPWDMIKMFIQDSNTGSRIVITTRLSNLANSIGSFHTYKMELLDETQSWSLLCRKVFGQESCPLELEEVGKLVAEKCKGLPLSIVVIGGLLRKSIKQEYWEYIAEDISASVNLEENEHCLKILYTSYNHLPIHLKPCFLYLGVFPEDHEILVSELIKLWVAERFLKPNKAKILEEVAIDYLKDLIDGNLIFVTKYGSIGSVKRCKVHDLLRDLCLREATKKKFLHVSKTLKLETSQGLNSHRRLAVCGEIPYEKQSLHFSSPFLRSFICHRNRPSLHSFDVKLLSVLPYDCYHPNDIYKLVNSRYLCFIYDRKFPRLVYLFWNLQTLILRRHGVSLPSEIWEVSQLRHIIIDEFTLHDPNAGKSDNIVLENFQTLSRICDFRCSEEVIRKIPNVKKLSILYKEDKFPSKYLKNLSYLTRLESLKFVVDISVLNFSLLAMEFSLSLKKLHIDVTSWDWEDIGEKVGLLPHLEKFTLNYACGGEEWNLVEGQFPRLKYLCLESVNLIHWTVDSTSFPCLEQLHLLYMNELEEIPSEIGDIPSLRSIEVHYCSDSVIDSAKMIRDEQMSLGNQDLIVKIESPD